jgi:hypothetical protein
VDEMKDISSQILFLLTKAGNYLLKLTQRLVFEVNTHNNKSLTNLATEATENTEVFLFSLVFLACKVLKTSPFDSAQDEGEWIG